MKLNNAITTITTTIATATYIRLGSKTKCPIMRPRASKDRKGYQYLINYFCSVAVIVATFLVIVLVEFCGELYGRGR